MLLMACGNPSYSTNSTQTQKPDTLENQSQYEVATLGTGCFWCTEAVFAELKGVKKAVSGYAGGKQANPTYKEVCTGTTGHAECIQITFDPKTISYAKLLEVFFQVHDPTTLNRQGADVGTQYRSVIFFHNEEQRKVATDIIAKLTAEKAFDNPIVTEVTKAPAFYPAEDYHQDYFAQNGNSNPYCQVVIRPKLDKFRKAFKDYLK